MSGQTTDQQVSMPLAAGTPTGAGQISGTGGALDGSKVPYAFLRDAGNPSATVPLATLAQEGTDSTDASAVQASGGVGLRGWLSTLVSLFRSGAAKVSVGAGTATIGSVKVTDGTSTITVTPQQALKVDGSAATQPISGTITANIGAVASLAQDGTDSTDANATQAAAGVGLRGWLSTLVSLQRSGAARFTLLRGSKTFSKVGVGTTAVQLLGANSSRKLAIISNSDVLLSVYLGKDNTVTSASGVPLAAGQAIGDDFSTDAWWAIAASGTVDVRLMEAA